MRLRDLSRYKGDLVAMRCRRMTCTDMQTSLRARGVEVSKATVSEILRIWSASTSPSSNVHELVTTRAELVANLRPGGRRASGSAIAPQSGRLSFTTPSHGKATAHDLNERFLQRVFDTVACVHSETSHSLRNVRPAKKSLLSVQSSLLAHHFLDPYKHELISNHRTGTANVVLNYQFNSQVGHFLSSVSSSSRCCAATRAVRKFGTLSPTLAPLRRTSLRGYHISASLGTPDESSSYDEHDQEPKPRYPRTGGLAQVQLFREELEQKYRAGWTLPALRDWLKLHGVYRRDDTLRKDIKAWGVKRKTDDEQLDMYKQVLIERRLAGASVGELRRWLTTQGIGVSSPALTRILKLWGAYEPHPKIVLLEEGFKVHKQEIIRRRRTGSTVPEIVSWLHAKGFSVGHSTIQRRLKLWGASTAELGLRQHQRPIDLEPFRETLTQKYLEGVSPKALLVWLRAQGSPISAVTLYKRLTSWGVPRQIPRPAPRSVDLEPYKETLIDMYNDGNGAHLIANWLTSREGTAVANEAVKAKLQQWNVWDPSRPEGKRRKKTLHRYKEELMQRYQAGATLLELTKQLRAHGEDVEYETVRLRLAEWGVLIRNRHHFIQNTEPHRETLCRMFTEGRSIQELLDWLETQGLRVAPLTLLLKLGKWGMKNHYTQYNRSRSRGETAFPRSRGKG